MRAFKKNVKLLSHAWAFVLGGVAVTISFVFSANPSLAEQAYSRSIYPTITSILTFLFSWLPFSLTEVILAALVVAAVVSLVRVFQGRLRFRRWLFYVGSAASLLIAWFYFTWGFNYSRQPLVQNLGLKSVNIDSAAFREIVEQVIAEANAAHSLFNDFDKTKIHRELEHGYDALNKELPIELPPGKRPPKSLVFNFFLTKFLTSGFFSPFLHEIHINDDLLPFEYASTLAHEKAHQMGIANEAEASFLGYLACMKSDDEQVLYSAKFYVLQKFLGRARLAFSDYGELQKSISDDVRNDLIASYEHWSQHVGVMSEFSSQAYDQYLKANRIAEGIKNYSGVVEMVALWKMTKNETNFEKEEESRNERRE